MKIYRKNYEQLIILIMIFGLFSCKQKENTFSNSEIQLLQRIRFEKDILIELKKIVKVEFVQFESSDPGFVFGKNGKLLKTGIEKQNGISFVLPKNKADDLVLKTRDNLLNQGYLIFISESVPKSPSTVSVIKSIDQFDILKIQKTDGINYDIENEDVIKKLKDWDKKFGIRILGADYDWVDLTIKIPSKDIPDFMKDVYKFCPDAVDQRVGKSKKTVSEFKRLVLWWD